MRRWAVLILALVTLSALAAVAETRWVKLHPPGKDGVQYLTDVGSISHRGNQLDWWFRVDLPVDMELLYGYYSIYKHFNGACGSSNITLVTEIKYNSKGTITSRQDPSKKVTIPLDSEVAVARDSICKVYPSE